MFGAEFPTPFTVEVLPFVSGALDAHRNPVESWQDPGVVQSVYGWGPPQDSKEVREPDTPGRSAVYAELDVYVPPGFVCGPHDRVRLEGRVYDVIGEASNYSTGPFGFTPGRRVSLKLVVG